MWFLGPKAAQRIAEDKRANRTLLMFYPYSSFDDILE